MGRRQAAQGKYTGHRKSKLENGGSSQNGILKGEGMGRHRQYNKENGVCR